MVDNEMLPLLANESCVEDIVPFIDDINECEQRVAMVQERALPSGKEYHLFISFSNEDKPYALSLKNALEGRGLKCMVADQDFIAGVPIMRNIEVFIEKSHKLLLLVSQHFLQSSYCNWEVEIAHLYAADNRRKDFMIVVRLDESKMPWKLGYMTYINGVDMDIDEVGRKVDEAFNNHVTNIRQIGRNGQEILRKKPYEASQKLCCSSSSQFDDLFESERDLIEPSSIRKSAELYRSLILCANDHTLFKRYGLFTFGRKALCFHFLLLSGIIALFSSFYLLGTTLAGTAFTLDMLALSSFGFAVLTISLHGLTVFILFRQMMSKLYAIVHKNTDCRSQCYLVLPRHQNFTMLNFIEKRAREHWPDASEEDIAKNCNDELVRTIVTSFKGTALYPIPQATFIRHDTHLNQCCLCQLASSPWTFKNTISGVRADKGINSEQDEEETHVMEIAGNENATGHRTTENEETGVKSVFGFFSAGNLVSTDNDETCLMKVMPNEQQCDSSELCRTTLTGRDEENDLTKGATEDVALLDAYDDQYYGNVHMSARTTDMRQFHVSGENSEISCDIEQSTTSDVVDEIAKGPFEDDDQCYIKEKSIDDETQEKSKHMIM